MCKRSSNFHEKRNKIVKFYIFFVNLTAHFKSVNKCITSVSTSLSKAHNCKAVRCQLSNRWKRRMIKSDKLFHICVRWVTVTVGEKRVSGHVWGMTFASGYLPFVVHCPGSLIQVRRKRRPSRKQRERDCCVLPLLFCWCTHARSHFGTRTRAVSCTLTYLLSFFIRFISVFVLAPTFLQTPSPSHKIHSLYRRPGVYSIRSRTRGKLRAHYIPRIVNAADLNKELELQYIILKTGLVNESSSIHLQHRENITML